MKTTVIADDWEMLLRFLPENWAAKAVELGALVRKRKIPTADTLLRVLLIHLADGKSLRTTAAYAREAGLCDVKDVALLYRLQESGEWLRWMASELLKQLREPTLPAEASKKYHVRIVDGTSISEPGSTGSDWRIHYCYQLNTLSCETCIVTTTKEVESFERYTIRPDDLLIGDRGYCKRKGIMHVVRQQGHVIVRFHSINLPLFTRSGKRFAVLEHLRSLADGQVGDWDVWFKDPEDGDFIKGRLCSLRKSKTAMELAKKRVLRMASKKGKKVRPETVEYAEYITLFATTSRHKFKGQDILSLYRGRWQVELAFKRLKSIIGVGHLHKHDPDSCVAWLYGKMLVALLVERLYREAESFSPWGYPIRQPPAS